MRRFVSTCLVCHASWEKYLQICQGDASAQAVMRHNRSTQVLDPFRSPLLGHQMT